VAETKNGGSNADKSVAKGSLAPKIRYSHHTAIFYPGGNIVQNSGAKAPAIDAAPRGDQTAGTRGDREITYKLAHQPRTAVGGSTKPPLAGGIAAIERP
jgi:hypothetical protein